MWSSTRPENVSNTCLDAWQKKKKKKNRKRKKAALAYSLYFQCVIPIVLYTFVCAFMCSRRQFFLFPISRSLLYLYIFFYLFCFFSSYCCLPPFDLARPRAAAPSVRRVRFSRHYCYYYYYFRPANINYNKIYMCVCVVCGLCVCVPLINQPLTGPHSISLCSWCPGGSFRSRKKKKFVRIAIVCYRTPYVISGSDTSR